MALQAASAAVPAPLRARSPGMRRVTMCVPGVLFKQRDAAALSTHITVSPPSPCTVRPPTHLPHHAAETLTRSLWSRL